MKGYKVFNSDWTCRGFQFEVGKVYEEDVVPKCCSRGFHFCTKAIDCFRYYNFDSNNKVAEVEALGKVDTHKDDTKCATNKIRIVRELSWHEVLGLVNTGNNNTGYGNTGSHNSGNWNSGHENSGHGNSGNSNSGSSNSGRYNSGHSNSGDSNSGYFNSGDSNTGSHNSGNYNSGNYNSGNYNSGSSNSGYYNSGYCNSGNRNSGNWNSGNENNGHNNSGNENSGDYNSGDFNKTDNSAGCFNTEKQKIVMFNKMSDWTFTDWALSKARGILMNIPKKVKWIKEDEMTNEEKEEHPEYETTGGFLKVSDTTVERQAWWDKLPQKDKAEVLSLPNFDSEIFFEITGIRA